MRLSFEGYSVAVTQAVFNHPCEGTSMLLSCVGGREASLAIYHSGHMHDQKMVFENDDGDKTLLSKFTEMRLSTSRLPCGLTHSLIVSREIAVGKILVAKTKSELMDKLWAACAAETFVPLHQSWRNWFEKSIRPSGTVCHGEVQATNLDCLKNLSTLVSVSIQAGILTVTKESEIP